MRFLKSILKSITKHKIIFIFLTLQFTICYFMIAKSYASYRIMNSKIDNVNKYIDVKSTYLFRFKNTSASLVYGGNDIKFFKECKNIDNISHIGTYNYRDPNASALKFGMLSINYDMLKIINAKLDEGRNLEPSDFKNSETEYSNVPIVIGSNLKSQYKIDDIITSQSPSFKGIKFQVVGSLKPNETFLGNNILSEKTINLDDSFMVPASFTIFQLANSYNNIFVQFKSNPKEGIEKLSAIAKPYKISFSIDSIKELIERQYEDDLVLFRNNLSISLFILIFSLFGISITMLMLVQSRKREFGIRIATGCTKSYIYKFILGEIFLVNIIGFVMGICAFSSTSGSTINHSMSQGFWGLFNYRIILTMIIGSFLLILLFSIGSAKSIYKMEPRELIKGRD